MIKSRLKKPWIGVFTCFSCFMLLLVGIAAQNTPNNHSINPTVFALATKAYQQAKKLELTTSSLITIVDYSLPSSKKRLWVIDLKTGESLFHTWVAHGSGSGANYAQLFSDLTHSHASSLGTLLTGTSYQGKHGYSLHLHGLEKGFNGGAFARSIVIHGAHYVSEAFIHEHGRLGRSHGCLAVNPAVTRKLINTIKNGTVLFLYYPDEKWLDYSKFLNH